MPTPEAQAVTNRSLAAIYLHEATAGIRILKLLFAEDDWSDVMRKERELSFYGDIDFVPTERYTRKHAQRALDDSE